MKNTKPITRCETCPMNTEGNEYRGYCNHPLAPKDNEQKSLYYHFNVLEKDMPKTNETSYGRYHFETKAIPVWCPLRKCTNINIGIEIEVKLDNQLFEENFT